MFFWALIGRTSPRAPGNEALQAQRRIQMTSIAPVWIGLLLGNETHFLFCPSSSPDATSRPFFNALISALAYQQHAGFAPRAPCLSQRVTKVILSSHRIIIICQYCVAAAGFRLWYPTRLDHRI